VHRDAARLEPIGTAEIGKVDDEGPRTSCPPKDAPNSIAASAVPPVAIKSSSTARAGPGDRVGVDFHRVDAVPS